MTKRYAGHDPAGRVTYVGTSPLSPTGASVPVPNALASLIETEIMKDCVVREGRLVVASSIKTSDLRVAFVSPFGVPCGISTYSEWLWESLLLLVGEGHVFAEEEEGPEVVGVTRCWRRGEPLTGLIQAIEDWDPDVVLIGHEYGYHAQARHWLSFLGALGNRKVVVTLHSVYAAHLDKTIVEAACPRIVVHTKQAKEGLLAHGVSRQIDVIPHGCVPPGEGKLWNLMGTPHSLIQFGFAGRYKGFDNALKVVASLKDRYPDIFYTALISERWPGASLDFVQELNALASELGITEHVALIRGYQSQVALDSYLRTNAVALFPYRDNGEHAVLGCSGAARVAMTNQIAVVAADVPLFDDLEDVVPRPSTLEGWAAAVVDAFENPEAQVRRQNAFLCANSWSNVAEQYLAVLSSAA